MSYTSEETMTPLQSDAAERRVRFISGVKEERRLSLQRFGRI